VVDDRGRVSRALVVALLAVLATAAAKALETDQFAAWRRPLADAAPIINAKIDLEISRALEELNRRPGATTCDDVAEAVRRRLHFEIFQPIELWAIQSPLLEHWPPRGDAEAHFLAESIYRRSRPWDIAMWMPLSPTIEVDGIRFGTDKLAHLVSSGWRYRDAYLRRIGQGDSAEEAVRAAIRLGILEEESVTGTLVDGIFSRSDLEANYAGMRFYLELCGGADPIVAREAGIWRVRRPYDIRTVVTPEWDESYLLPVYHEGRWRRVRPEITARCGELDDPAVRSRFEAYRRRDTLTPTERVLDELAHEGKLPDLAEYSLAAICPQAGTLPTAPEHADAPILTGPAFPARLEDRLIALGQDRSRRVFGLWRGAFSHPLSLSASLGAVVAGLPRTEDCRSLCELRGMTVHVSAGLTGGELAVGWAQLFAASDARRHFLTDVSLGFGVRAALVRTWGASRLEPPAQTLAGVETALTITRVSFTLGVLVPLAAGAEHHRRTVTGSVGFGF
jgi:hypothetical protein